ncbi:hypothetical protein MD588_19010 [Photobacterium sp. SDRW27]|uniref:hypothetical protein n=1 Tax=Photobacterium obscurum TaxID=2829490 RepID=UPI0022443755|nr:hypothetical protein [Photobacterium obscurum]MCW8330887.1 hypothetical protein [Photobacterium obscurum]
MLSTNELLYVAGAVQPADETKNNQAAYDSGFLGFHFCGPQPEGAVSSLNTTAAWGLGRVSRENEFLADMQKTHEEAMPDVNRDKLIREAAARSDENNRLVQGRKSPTHPQQAQLDKILRQERKLQRGNTELVSTEAVYNHDTLYAITEDGNQARVLSPKGKSKIVEPKVTPNMIRLMNRDWSGQYKIQYYTQTPSSAAPDAQQGDRYTEKLTKRAVSKIFESGAYVATCHGGFTTFLTLTFTKEQRARIMGGMVEGDAAPYCTLPKPPLPPSKTRGARSMLRGRPQLKCTDGTNTPVKIKRNMAAYIEDIAGPYCYIDTMADDPAATVDILDDGSVKVMNENGEIAGPYTPTFLKPEKEFTLTKTAETTIGKEVSRFLDGAKKMYQRGWVASHTVEVDAESGAKYCTLAEKAVSGYTRASEFGPTQEPADFHYIWVAECPANEHGEPNPHVHILLNWSVPQPLFSAWSKRLEKLWGNGFANLQWINKPKAAGSYIIKAVGYAAKGENADQGLIKGNRYNIARCSRAPAWDCVASFEADNMAAIIKECGYKLEQWRTPINRRLKRLEKQLDQTIKAKAIAKQAKKPKEAVNKMTARIIRLENQMKTVRDQLKSREVFAQTKNIFCLSFDGENAEDKAYDFLLWAAGARGWSMTPVADDTEYIESVTEAKAVARQEYAKQYQQFQLKRAYWHSVLTDPLAPPTEGDPELALSRSMMAREQYESLQLAA